MAEGRNALNKQVGSGWMGLVGSRPGQGDRGSGGWEPRVLARPGVRRDSWAGHLGPRLRALVAPRKDKEMTQEVLQQKTNALI